MGILKHLNYYIVIDKETKIKLIKSEEYKNKGKQLMFDYSDGKIWIYVSQPINNLPKTAKNVCVLNKDAKKLYNDNNSFDKWVAKLTYTFTSFKVNFLGFMCGSEEIDDRRDVIVSSEAHDMSISNKPKSILNLQDVSRYDSNYY